MFTSMKHNIAIAGVITLLCASSAMSESLSYTPANPDKYPYPSETIDMHGNKINNDGAIKKPQNFSVNHVNASPFSAKGFHLGEKATKEQVEAWDTDVRPDGKGLPKGSMSVAKGSEVFIAKCGACHGDFGEGVDKFPVLTGGMNTLKLHPQNGGEPGPLKTFGSYLPYIAPMFWYIQTAMPLASPKSLTNSEVYGILGYLLQVNDIKVNGALIEDDTIIDATFIKAVHMPNEKGFEYNNLRKSDTQNKRCMKDCLNPKNITIQRIVTDGTEVEPEFGEERYFYGEVGSKAAGDVPGQATYVTYCAGCHESGLAGSPKLGDKTVWAKAMSKGLDTVLKNAIMGVGAMPPKGGATDLSDDAVSDAATYMINQSK